MNSRRLFLIAALSALSVYAAEAGDLLRGGASAPRSGAAAQANALGSAAAEAAARNQRDALARTTRAVQDVRKMQDAARAAALQNQNGLQYRGIQLPEVPNGLVPGGLQVAPGVPADLANPVAGENSALWKGADLPVQTQNGEKTTVNIVQKQSQALLNWKTFNVGKETKVNFDQSAGGADSGKWIAFNQISDPSLNPSQILGGISAEGQVYVLNQNGILFGGSSQINLRSLVASSLPINETLQQQGLLNLQAGNAQFLFSALPQSGYTLPAPPPGGVYGDVEVRAGAVIQTSRTVEGSGGRIILAAPNVTNGGSLSSPGGQVILAAGLQVGFDAHAKLFPQIPGRLTGTSLTDDPSLRGLDTYVGEVGPASGSLINSGMISIPTGSVTMIGRAVEQNGAIESTTTVSLNGRIDLLAAYGAVPNTNFDGLTSLPFLNRSTGTLRLGSTSSTRILPLVEPGATTVGTGLPLRSQINMLGRDVYFGPESSVLAPNANVAVAAGEWGRVLTNVQGGFFRNTDDFVLTAGQVYLDTRAMINVSGSTDVFVPQSNFILQVQLRGSELAVSPIQRDSVVRGASLIIDSRVTGNFLGREFIGTPLGDAAGFADVVSKNASQLTASGGSISISAGQAVVTRAGSVLDVSGGYFVNQGGLVQTTRLRLGDRVMDISEATPDLRYDGIYDGTSTFLSQRWGISHTYANALALLGGRTEASYLSGAAGGSLDIRAPGMALDGELLGRTVQGERQLRQNATTSQLATEARLRLFFTGQREVLNNGGVFQIFTNSPTPPAFTFGQSGNQSAPAPFLEQALAPLSAERLARVFLGGDFYAASGFNSLVIDNSEGEFLVQSAEDIELPAGAGLTVSARRITIESSIRAAGGRLNFTAYNLLRYGTAIDQLTILGAPPVDPRQGTITLASGVDLDVAGLVVDDRLAETAGTSPLLTAGGDIALVGYNVVLPSRTSLNASGGAQIPARGSVRYGNGGKLTVKAGQDPQYRSILGGRLELQSELLGYAGGVGATLALQAPLVQIGGRSPSPDTLLLTPDFFSQGGFARFELTGLGAAIASPGPFDPDAPIPFVPAVRVVSGTELTPRAESYVLNNSVGGDLVQRRLFKPVGQRPAVSLALFAGTIRNDFADPSLGTNGSPGDVLLRRGDIVLESGTKILLDPGATFEARGSTLEARGTIVARGGTISLAGAAAFPQSALELVVSQVSRPTVLIAASARLDARGMLVPLPDAFGRRLATTLNGGNITVAGNIVAETGAWLDVSGDSGIVDVHPVRLGLMDAVVPASSGLTGPLFATLSVPYRAGTSGGRIQLSGGEMLFSNATLRGEAGGPTATGGTLSVSSGRYYAPGVNQFGSDTNLVVRQSGATVPFGSSGIGTVVRDAAGQVIPAMGYFSVSQFVEGKFSSLELGVSGGAAAFARGGNVEFQGPVRINADGFLRLASGGVIRADAPVALSASYVAIGQDFREPVNPADPDFFVFQKQEAGFFARESVLPTGGSASLAITGDLIDVGTLVTRNIGEVALRSRTDIRGNGTLSVAGLLSLSAAQIYPTTLSRFDILAYDVNGTPGRIEVTAAGRQPAPLSAGGTLSLFASQIAQGGVLIAPFGQINIGWDGTDLDAPIDPASNLRVPVATSVTLQSGSVSSVAGIDPVTGRQLLAPFGLSLDGLTLIDPSGVNVTATGLPEKRVVVSAANIVSESGSTIDIRGGGDLFAYQWVPGPGGAVDILGEASRNWSGGTRYEAGDLVRFGGRTYSTRLAIDPVDFAPGAVPVPGVNRYFSLVAESYAVVPEYSSRFAPFAPFNTGINATKLGFDPGYVSNSLTVGDRIYLQGGGLIATGEYTLLPRRYALLPGAFLVTPQDGAVIGPAYQTDGSLLTAGRVSNVFREPPESPKLLSRFEVAPRDVVTTRAQYSVLTLNSFLREAAERRGLTSRQLLPGDAGYLSLQGAASVSLAGQVRAKALSDFGRAGQIDISSFSDFYITGNGQAAPAGANALSASLLTGYGAGSLVIGGIRRTTPEGLVVEIRTNRITLDNAGTTLSAADVSLLSAQELTLGAGARLEATGMVSDPLAPILIRGNGVAVRASVAGGGILRSDFSSSAQSRLNVGPGASVAGGVVTLDSARFFQLDPSAVVRTFDLRLGAGQISIGFDVSGGLAGQLIDPHLVIAGQFLQDAQSSANLSLLSYQNSIDIYGTGTFGQGAIRNLSLSAGEIRGFGQGTGTAIFRADTILLSKSGSAIAPGPIAPTTGELRFEANVVAVTGGDLAISQYAKVTADAREALDFRGTGSLTASGDLEVNTPQVVAQRGADQALVAGGTLRLLDPGTGSAYVGGIGGKLRLVGSDVAVYSEVRLPTGVLAIEANGPGGGVLIGGKIDLSGTATQFYDVTRYTDGGELRLRSATGDVTLLSSSEVSVAAPAGGGDGGFFLVEAKAGSFVADGLFQGQGGVAGQGGSFALDVQRLNALQPTPFDALRDVLNAGGFTESRIMCVRQGDLVVNGTSQTRNYVLSADGGDIRVTGTIDASGRTGGRIALSARGSVILESVSVLTAAADQFDSAAKGGEIALEAGASSNGLPNLLGAVTLETGATVDLSVAAYRQGATVLANGDYRDPTSSAFLGQFQGTLHLRAPQTAGFTDLGVGPLAGNIVGASSIFVEGYRVYTPAGGVMNIALRDSIKANATAFIGANEAALRTKLFGSTSNAALDPILVIGPGAEIVNLNGNLVLGQANLNGSTNPEARSSADWDLSSFRFGTRNAPGVLTLRASGDIIINNTLSDGFTPVAATQGNGHSTMWLGLQQTLDVDATGQLRRPVNTQSWSYRLTSGADFGSARVTATGDGGAGGSLYVGEFHSVVPNNLSSGAAAAVGDNGLTSNTIRISTTTADQGTRFEVIRTGTGSIVISARQDVQLRNQFATIYTAGVGLPNPGSVFAAGDFEVPLIPIPFQQPSQGPLGATQQNYGPLLFINGRIGNAAQYAVAGGNLALTAGGDIGRFSRVGGTVVLDSSRQLPNNWLYRRGSYDPATGLPGNIIVSGSAVNDPSASTSWWIDYSNFFQGVGTLGGGNISLDAAGDLLNIDAVVPTNARMAGRDAAGNPVSATADRLLELGGGDIRAKTGGDISGGVFYVERGTGQLIAGGEITTNEARSPTFGFLKNPADPTTRDVSEMARWLPTTLFLGKGGFDVDAAGDILLGPVVNPFWLPQGLNNKFWYKTYFSTYGSDSFVNAQSESGAVTLRTSVTNAGGALESVLTNWLQTQNRYTTLGNNPPLSSIASAAFYRPWLRLAETAVNDFQSVSSTLPPVLSLTSISGDINLVGDATLFPSPVGNLSLGAAGNLNGLNYVGTSSGKSAYFAATVNVSDAAPASLPGTVNPTSYFVFASGQNLNATSNGFLSNVSLALSESGSVQGADGTISRKRARHSPTILHADDLVPLRVYANTGDISGLRLFSPKKSQVAAGRDLTDIAFYLQNVRAEDISIVSAGRDLVLFNEESALRSQALRGSNFIINQSVPREDGSFTTARAGELQIGGPGVLEAIAGANLDLGTSEKFGDGTGAGITSIGRVRNPFLPFEGAELVVLAGVGGADGGGALGLADSLLDFSVVPPATTSSVIVGETEEHDALRSLLGLFALLKQPPPVVDPMDPAPPVDAYAAATVLANQIFGVSSGSGDIFTRTRDLRTTSGGGITIAAPRGGMTMASSLITTTLTPPGIVTEFGGEVNIVLQNDLEIGATRIFTLRGGDLTIWSLLGSIAAGSTAKTVVTAPPTRVSIDATSAEVQTDLGGLATGGGIGVLASVQGVMPGSVTLVAPLGTIDAGDAGIRATGNISLAAANVINADNISAGGTATGVPPAAAPASVNVSGLTAASAAGGAATNSAEDLAKQAQPDAGNQTQAPSIIEVQVIGYGG